MGRNPQAIEESLKPEKPNSLDLVLVHKQPHGTT